MPCGRFNCPCGQFYLWGVRAASLLFIVYIDYQFNRLSVRQRYSSRAASLRRGCGAAGTSVQPILQIQLCVCSKTISIILQVADLCTLQFIYINCCEIIRRKLKLFVVYQFKYLEN